MTNPSKSSVLHWQTGMELSDHARPRDVIDEFTTAIELSPHWPLPYFWRAGVYDMFLPGIVIVARCEFGRPTLSE